MDSCCLRLKGENLNIYKNYSDSELKKGDLFKISDGKHLVLGVKKRGKLAIITLSDNLVDDVSSLVEIEKIERLENLTVEVNGKVFSVNDTSQSRIDRALTMAETLEKTETEWKLAEPFNGSKAATVTITELREALFRGMYLIGKEVLEE